MFRSNNKVNPGRKKKLQEKSKQAKAKNLLEQLAKKEQSRREHAERLAYLTSVFKPGCLYITNVDMMRTKNRLVYFKPPAIVLFISLEVNEHNNNFFNFKVIYGEDIGFIIANFKKAQDVFKLVDTTSC